jgi:hypothetical protein
MNGKRPRAQSALRQRMNLEDVRAAFGDGHAGGDDDRLP